MFSSNTKISLPLLAAFLGAGIGALNEQFVWSFLCAVGAWMLVAAGQNLYDFQRATDRKALADASNGDHSIIKRADDRSNRVGLRNDEIIFDPSFEGTPGNIWSRSVSTDDD